MEDTLSGSTKHSDYKSVGAGAKYTKSMVKESH
jgi:hypothetical protein